MAVASVEKAFPVAERQTNGVSIVVPVFDERESLPTLTDQILDVAGRHDFGLHELIFVDDGSRDGSWSVMKDLAASNSKVTSIKLRRNFGKATALNVGIEAASGDIIVTMDADLQDDPAELPKLIETMRSGYDLVSGWRERRNDPCPKPGRPGSTIKSPAGFPAFNCMTSIAATKPIGARCSTRSTSTAKCTVMCRCWLIPSASRSARYRSSIIQDALASRNTA